jgi:hypothetical protein
MLIVIPDADAWNFKIEIEIAPNGEGGCRGRQQHDQRQKCNS